MVALTNAQKQKAHRRRMAEKMARYEGALRNMLSLTRGDYSLLSEQVFSEANNALNPTDPAKS